MADEAGEASAGAAAAAVPADANAPLTGLLLVRGFPNAFFTNVDALPKFEKLLREHGEVQSVVLLPGYRAARVRYSDEASADKAALALRFSTFMGGTLDCITGTHLESVSSTFDNGDGDEKTEAGAKMDRLEVPHLEKQWLISPPPSPPEGWAPRSEDPPIFNAELVEALQGLDPTVERELHAAKGSRPSITVQLTDVDREALGLDAAGPPEGAAHSGPIPHTSMPPAWARDGQTHGAPWSKGASDKGPTKRPPGHAEPKERSDAPR